MSKSYWQTGEIQYTKAETRDEDQDVDFMKLADLEGCQIIKLGRLSGYAPTLDYIDKTGERKRVIFDYNDMGFWIDWHGSLDANKTKFDEWREIFEENTRSRTMNLNYEYRPSEARHILVTDEGAILSEVNDSEVSGLPEKVQVILLQTEATRNQYYRNMTLNAAKYCQLMWAIAP